MENITERYNKYKLKVSNESIKQICSPKEFKLQPQQQFIPEFVYDNKEIVSGLLIYHKIGSGKTCTAINIAEKFKYTYNIIVVLPAALINNFKGELMSECPGKNVYVKENEKNKLNDKNILEKIERRISKYYQIYSYNKFTTLVQEKKIKLEQTVLIIDEIQNMISLRGVFYKTLKSAIDKTNNTLKIFLLSATPMFDKPSEIALTLNLLRPKIQLPVGNNFNNKFLLKQINNNITYKAINLELFKELTYGLVSYYRGAPIIAFPNVEFKIVKCNMSDFQYKSYLTSLSKIENVKGIFKNTDILKLSGNFMLGPRMMSNIAYPNKSIGDIGYSSLSSDILLLQNIKDYSIKFYKIFKRIKKCEGKIFVYSNFVEYGGIKPFILLIEAHGYLNYSFFGSGKKRYCLFTGDEINHNKKEIITTFNNINNNDGSIIKIIIGSPSIKEGVSLLSVQQVHILEPYWNQSRIEQIIGRSVRFCSHSSLLKQFQCVKVYLYLSTHNKTDMSIDEYIYNMSLSKQTIINEFTYALIENAIDCSLFYNNNYYKTDNKKLICTNK